MTQEELRSHIQVRASMPGGTISRRENENLAGEMGTEHNGVHSVALAFILAAHAGEPQCDCVHCSCGR